MRLPAADDFDLQMRVFFRDTGAYLLGLSCFGISAVINRDHLGLLSSRAWITLC